MIKDFPFFKVTKPDGLKYTIDFKKAVLTQTEEIYISLGRESNNHIVLADLEKKISRQHCAFVYKNNRWWIIDRGSANGTFLQREIERSEIDVRSEDAIALRSGDLILILGKLNIDGEPIFWRLKFIDPGETFQVPVMQAVHSLEYSLSSQTLFGNIARRRDPISISEQERSLIDYMSRKNYYNHNRPSTCEYDELIEAVWNNDSFNRDSKAINNLVWRIREKIEPDSGEPQFLKTVKGRGYILAIKVVS